MNKDQQQAIKYAEENQVKIVLLGFDLNNDIESKLLDKATVRLIAPPITYTKILNICDFEVELKARDNLIQSRVLKVQPLNILVVEDNNINQQVSTEMLEKMGHCVDIVDSAEEALTMLGRSKYDLLLVDYHLPGMDGLKMISMWENISLVPVIVVTADLTDDLYNKCHKLGVDNIVAKPFTQQVLSEAITKAFD